MSCRVDDLTARLEEFTGREGLEPAVEISQEKISTLAEFWPLAGSFYDGPIDDPKAREKFLEPQESREALADVRERSGRPARAVDRVQRRGGAARRRRADGAQAKAIFQPLRVALTGTTVSPGIFETVALLGRDETLARVGRALDS